MFKPKPRWAYEMFMAYQVPIFTSSQISIKPEVMFNGSIGAYYKYTPTWYIGSFWYGQLHSYSYSTHNSSFGEDFSGRQQLFFSNIELRIGYEL
jgi:hypothetical protein